LNTAQAAAIAAAAAPTPAGETPTVTTMDTCGGDDVSYQVPITATVTFDGQQYTSVYATTNAVITFGRPDNTYWTYPQTPSISLYSMDWFVYPQAHEDEHFIINSSDGGFQVDIAARPCCSGAPITNLGNVTNIIITAAINTDGTVAIAYAVSGPTYVGQTRTGVRLNNGNIVTLEEYGVVRVETAPILAPDAGGTVIEPEPTVSPSASPTPSVSPSEGPTPSPTPSETPTQTAEPSPTPSPSTSPSQNPEPSPTPTPEVTLSPEPSPAPAPVPEPSPNPLPEPVVPPAVEPEPFPMPPVPPALEPEPSPEPSPDPQAIPDPIVPVEPPVDPEPVPVPEPEPIPAPEPPVAPEPTPEPVPAPEPPVEAESVSEQVTAFVDDLLSDGKLSASDADKVLESLNADGEVTKDEVNALSDALSADGKLTEKEKELVAEALIESIASGETLTKEQIQDAGIAYQDLPPATPVEVRQDENGNEVIITADVAAALVLLESPSELIGAIFSDPGQALQALGSIGADMSAEERKESTEAVVATVIAAGAAINAVGAATGGASSGTGGSSGGGNSGGGGASGDSKGVGRRKL